MVIYNMYIFKKSQHRWSSMVVGSKGWAERRYTREVKDVQRTSDTSRILKDIQKAFSGSNTEGRTQCLQSQRRRFYTSSACRGAIPVPTVATSEVLRFECLPRCYSTAPIFATSEVLRSELEVSHTTRFQGHGHIAPPSAPPSSEPERRPNTSTTPRKN